MALEEKFQFCYILLLMFLLSADTCLVHRPNNFYVNLQAQKTQRSANTCHTMHNNYIMQYTSRAHMLQCTSQIHSRSFLISIQVLAACLTKIFVFVDLLIISRHVPYSIRQSSSNYTIYFNPSVLPPSQVISLPNPDLSNY